ncbi:hypothetical protein ACFP65_08405 [Marinilactibacillus sp. GCM10026970]|uniref:hypothetical protein n=1 Tax=Marinilactibacillus sp. GCM10026970 TaxID=3252642 RepID=UPI00361C13D2
MFSEKLGFFPKTMVEFDGKRITLGKNNVIDNYELDIIYVFKPSAIENGYVYFSKTGDQPSSSIHIVQRGFFYTKKQQDLVNTLIDSMEELEVEFKPGNSLKSKTQTVKTSTQKQPKANKNAIRCTSCKSTNVEFMKNNKKNFSVGKAAAGAILTGGIGTIAGFAGKDGKKNTWHCRDCGQTFVSKK